ncbi:MAG: hypothetical protein WDN28_15425 [Chthoniobacter sp.]
MAAAAVSWAAFFSAAALAVAAALASGCVCFCCAFSALAASAGLLLLLVRRFFLRRLFGLGFFLGGLLVGGGLLFGRFLARLRLVLEIDVGARLFDRLLFRHVLLALEAGGQLLGAELAVEFLHRGGAGPGRFRPH